MADRVYVSVCSFVVHTTGFLRFTPFTWNTQKKRITLRSEQALHQLRVYYLNYNTLYLAIIVLQISCTWSKIPPNSLVQAFCLANLTAIIYCVPTSYVSVIKAKEIANLLNILLDTLAQFPGTTVSKREWQVLEYVCKMLSLTSYSFWLLFVNEMINPCFPTAVGYWLSPQCWAAGEPGFLEKGSIWTFKEVLTRFVITIANFLSVQSLACNLYVVICLILIKAHMFFSLIKHLARKIKVAKTYSHAEPALQVYRKLQINLRMFRAIYSNESLLTIACGGMGMQALGIYIAVDLLRKGKETGGQFFLLAICGWCAVALAITILFVYGKLALIFLESKAFKADIKRNSKIVSNKRFAIFLRSCPLLRVYFGPDNFVEPGTPTKMEEFVVDQTTSLLLL